MTPLAHRKAILAAERDVELATLRAFEAWLPLVLAAVTTGDAPAVVAASAPNLSAFESTRDAWARHAQQILDAVGAVWLARFAASGALDSPQRTQRLANYLARVKHRLFAVPDQVFNRLTGIISDATRQALSVQEMTDLLKEELTPSNPLYAKRADVIGRTEAIAAYNAGSQNGYETVAKVSGARLNKEWLAIDDERTRPTHAVAGGQRVPIDGYFRVGGFFAEYPGDPSLPAYEAVQCRCVAIYGTSSELEIVAAIGDTVSESMPEVVVSGAIPNGWRGVMAPIGRPTGDGRQLNMPEGGIRTRQLPLTFGWAPSREGGHDGAVMAGRIDRVWMEGDLLWGEGPLDVNGVAGSEYARQLGEGFADTVSVDPDEVTFEQRFYGPDGQEVPASEAINAAGDALNPGYTVRDVMTDWRLMGVTAVQIPAFDEARIEPVYDYQPFVEPLAQPDHSGSAMLALHPRNPHLYAIEGGTAAEDLHVTLHYLGDAAELTNAEMLADFGVAAKSAAEIITPGESMRVAGYGVLGDGGATVLFLNGDAIYAAHQISGNLIGQHRDALPVPHSPYLAHMTLGYGVDLAEAARYMGEEIPLGSVDFHYGQVRTSYAIQHNPNSAPYASDEEFSAEEPIVAAAGQVFTPEFFEDPQLEGPTALTVTPEGRVYGHVALWGSCYMSFGNTGKQPCISIPPSQTGYERFHVHGARLPDGSVLPVGAITFGDGHRAAGGLRASSKLYADIATMAAKARVGEDAHGVWISGQVLDVFADRADDLLLSPLSGHWEPDLDVNGNLEMLAAHVVTTPGLKVPRLVATLGENGDVLAFQASGPWSEPDIIAVMDESLVATVTGSTGLPVADSGTAWDGSKASQRVFAHFTANGHVSASGVAKAFLWKDPNSDPEQVGSYKLGFADIINGTLTIVPRGVSAAAGRLNQTQGIPSDEKAAIQRKITSLYAKIKKTDKNWPASPFASAESAIVSAVQVDRRAQRALARLGVDPESRALAALARLNG